MSEGLKIWGRASSYVGRTIFPLWLKYLGLTDMGGGTLLKMKKKSIWPHLWYSFRLLFFAQHFFYFNLKHASHFKCSKWDFKRDNAIKIIYLWSCLQKTATYITFLWYLDHVPPMNFRLDFVSSSKSHYFFTRLNLKKMGTLQFCFSALLGICRNPKQKEFLKSS